MTDAEIKIAIARCAVSGVSMYLEKCMPGINLIECDRCFDSPRTAQIIATIDGWPRQFEFTVREVIG